MWKPEGFELFKDTSTIPSVNDGCATWANQMMYDLHTAFLLEEMREEDDDEEGSSPDSHHGSYY
jgi:hypothetical protein